MTNEATHERSVFDCWSGERSRAVASAMRWLLKELFKDDIKVFFSEDINKGKVWFEEVQTNLSRARAAILCLTPENIDSPWLHFEAGALSVGLAQHASIDDARNRVVYPYLLEVDPRSLAGGPLASFQATNATREDTMRMVTDLAVELFDEGQESVREKAYLCSTLWEQFEQRFRDHKPPDITAIMPGFEKMFRRKTFDETLGDCSGQHWIDRYDAARDSLRQLQSVESQVADLCNRSSCDLFVELTATVNAYAMDLKATLLQEREFERDGKTGEVLIDPPGAGHSCDQRRRKIKKLVAELLDPKRIPIIEEAVQFRHSEMFEDKKRLIHRIEDRIAEEGDDWREMVRRDGPRSDWDLDRVAAYIVVERSADSFDASASILAIERELELVRSHSGTASFVPLHYVLRMILTRLQKATSLEPERLATLQRVLDDVLQTTRPRQSAQIERMVERIKSVAGIRPDSSQHAD